MDEAKKKVTNRGVGGSFSSSAVSVTSDNSNSHIHTQSEKRRRKRRRRRAIKKTLLQVGPCVALLFTCWMIIQLQKRQMMHDDIQKNALNDDIILASDIIDVFKGGGESHNSTTTLSSSSSFLDVIHRYPFNGLSDVTQPIIEHDEGDETTATTTKKTTTKTIALYWQIPRTGGTTLKHILGSCLNLVQASRMSVDYCDVEDPELHICSTKNLGSYVNADTSDDHGIQRAQEMQLVSSGLVDVVVSSRFLHVAALFDVDHRGRVFTVIRDPVDRIVSTFYYLQSATWERNYDVKYKVRFVRWIFFVCFSF